MEILPEEVLVHLMELCSGGDLLKLSETCQTFKTIVFNESKLMRKIRLNIEIEKDGTQTLDDVIKICAERKFTDVKLIKIELPTGNEKKQWKTIQKTSFNRLIRVLLINLKNLEIRDFKLAKKDDNVKKTLIETTPKEIEYPLENLYLWNADARVLNGLSCCHKVKTFQSTYCEDDSFRLISYLPDGNLIADFIKNQRDLKVFRSSQYGFYNKMTLITAAWINMPFKLQELKVCCIYRPLEATFVQFLKTQDQLKKLSMRFDLLEMPQVMKAICELPALKELIVRGEPYILRYEEVFEGLSNRTVTTIKMVYIMDAPDLVERFCETFKAAEIEIHDSYLHDFSHKYLEKITIKTKYQSHLYFVYCSLLPESKEDFERDVLKFVSRHSEKIDRVFVEVHHGEDEIFEFSLEFCKSLMQTLPHLRTLKLSKVAELDALKEIIKRDYPRIITFIESEN